MLSVEMWIAIVRGGMQVGEHGFSAASQWDFGSWLMAPARDKR